MPKKTHPISELYARMDPEVLAKAKNGTIKESLNVRLAILLKSFPRLSEGKMSEKTSLGKRDVEHNTTKPQSL